MSEFSEFIGDGFMTITLNVRTLLIALTLINLTFVFILLVFRSIQKVYPGYFYWLAAMLCVALTYGFAAWQDILPIFFAYVVVNTAALFASVFRLEAIKRFVGDQRFSIFNFLIPAFVLPLVLYFTFGQPSARIRNFFFTLPTVLLVWQMVWVLYKSYGKTQNIPARFLGVLLFLFSALSILRLFLWTISPPTDGILQNTALNLAAHLFLLFFDVSINVGFILLNTQRLSNDVLALNRELSELHQAIEQSPSSIVITDLDGYIQYVNPYFSELTGYSLQEAVKMHTRKLKSGEVSPAMYESMWGTIQSGLPWRGELLNKRKDGSLYWEFTMIAPIQNANAEVTRYIAFKENITERKRDEERLRQSELDGRRLNQQLQARLNEVTRLKAELQEQAIRDPLTGLYNRRYLFDFLQRELKLAKRQPKTLSLLLLDIDHFKKINDTYGHNTGDTVLQSVARLLQEFTRETDLACRYGGEEFLLLLPDIDCDTALQRAETLRQTVQETCVPYLDHRLSVTISVGLAVYPADGSDYAEIIQKADEALYEAKEQGRNRVISTAMC
ncbi:MAG: diguanylate cyclase [Anaerolineae bacterium]|jgi:diguanylate cyclase (GGDEF)-like protein/PAS domain S-box-containing protein|nr:diguanylate cyclase [Anaerolineae bacterium]